MKGARVSGMKKKLPDMTMCRDDSCPMKTACYRFMLKGDDNWQSYFVTSPRDGDTCTYQIK